MAAIGARMDGSDSWGLYGRPLRSLLFCPGDSERKIGKALESGADAVIIDLEDSIAPAAKTNARSLAAVTLRASRNCTVLVRVNAEDTEYHLEDLAAIVVGKPDAVMLPKCAGADELVALQHASMRSK